MAVDSDVEIISNDEEVDEVIDDTEIKAMIDHDGTKPDDVRPFFGHATTQVVVPNPFGLAYNISPLEKLLAKTPRRVTLSQLQSDFNDERKDKAIARLSHPTIIDYQDEIIDPADPALFYPPGIHYLDALCVVGQFGLSAIIPDNPVTGFALTIYPKRFATASYQDKYSFLPWDITNRAIMLGEVPAGDVWLAFRPRGIGNDIVGEPVISPGVRRPSTIMEKTKLRVFLIFLADALSKMEIGILQKFSIEQIELMQEVGARKTLIEDDEVFYRHCNLSNGKPKRLSYEQVNELNKHIINNWEVFRDFAFSDLFGNEFPHIVLSRYGQNMPFCRPGQEQPDITYLEQIINLLYVDHISYAMATEKPCYLDVGDRRRQCGMLVNLETVPSQYNERPQKPFNRYDSEVGMLDGFVLGAHGPEGSAKYDSQTYRRGGPKIDADNDEDMTNAIDRCLQHIYAEGAYCDIYPHANTKTAGTIQSKGHPAWCKAACEIMEESLGTTKRPSAIFPGHYQEYSAISHSTRPSTAESDLVQGTLGAYGIGKCLNGTASFVRKVRDLGQRVKYDMPLDRFADRIDGAENLAIRKEPTYIISVKDIPAEKRNWSDVYHCVIKAGALYWDREDVWMICRNDLIIFKPKVFPDIYKHTNYPLYCALDALLKHVAMAKKILDPTIGETIALFERVAAYASNGNSKLIPYRLGKALGVVDTIKLYGAPAFASQFTLIACPSIPAHKWPTNDDGSPLLCSEWAVTKHFGRDAYTRLTKQMYSSVVVAQMFNGLSPSSKEGIRHLAEGCVKMLADDLWTLVSTQAFQHRRMSTLSALAIKRMDGGLKQLELSSAKFARTDRNIRSIHLLTGTTEECLDVNYKDFTVPISNTESITAASLVTRIIQLGKDAHKLAKEQRQPRIREPFTKDGKLWNSMRLVWDTIVNDGDADAHQVEAILHIQLLRALSSAQIQQIPWVMKSNNAGRSSTKVSIHSWTIIDYPLLDEDDDLQEVINTTRDLSDDDEIIQLQQTPQKRAPSLTPPRDDFNMDLADEQWQLQRSPKKKMRNHKQRQADQGRAERLASRRAAHRQVLPQVVGAAGPGPGNDGPRPGPNGIDLTIPWRLHDIQNMDDLCHYFEHPLKPTDILNPDDHMYMNQSNEASIEINTWVRTTAYDWTNRTHRLAIFLGYMISKRCPKVEYKSQPPHWFTILNANRIGPIWLSVFLDYFIVFTSIAIQRYPPNIGENLNIWINRAYSKKISSLLMDRLKLRDGGPAKLRFKSEANLLDQWDHFKATMEQPYGAYKTYSFYMGISFADAVSGGEVCNNRLLNVCKRPPAYDAE